MLYSSLTYHIYGVIHTNVIYFDSNPNRDITETQAEFPGHLFASMNTLQYIVLVD